MTPWDRRRWRVVCQRLGGIEGVRKHTVYDAAKGIDVIRLPPAVIQELYELDRDHPLPGQPKHRQPKVMAAARAKAAQTAKVKRAAASKVATKTFRKPLVWWWFDLCHAARRVTQFLTSGLR